MMYHGWDDPSISPINSIKYYTGVVERIRDKHHLNSVEAALTETQKSALLFLIPGMGHCGGGPGADTFDAIGTLDQWIDRGVAPDKIIASHRTPAYTRPLCAYPQEARPPGNAFRKPSLRP
jgi:feruloyl esterase